MIVSLTIKVDGSLCAFSSITQGRNPKTMEMQTRDPLVHPDHQGFAGQKVNIKEINPFLRLVHRRIMPKAEKNFPKNEQLADMRGLEANCEILSVLG